MHSSEMEPTQDLIAPQKPAITEGAIGQLQPTGSQQVELDHSIGFSGKVVDSVFLHPALKEYILIAGSSLVVRDL